MPYFIDSHCHFFNIGDIPISTTLSRLPLERLGLTAAATAPVLPALLNKMIKSFSTYINFFERDIDLNIRNVTTEACESPLIPKDRTKIFTPLIMDFEKANGNERLIAQVRALRDGIKFSEKHLANNKTKILPFLGVDLRRLNKIDQSVEQWFDTLLKECDIAIKAKNERQDMDSLQNGDFIGIKLYPALGFEIFPEHSPSAVKRQLEFFKLLQQRSIPITVHCQNKGTFKQGSESDDTLANNGNPERWLKVMKSKGLSQLTINFAHFSGEDDVKESITSNKPGDTDLLDGPSYDEPKIWTWDLVRLLRKYPNTYSDLSAFDFENTDAVYSLAWLISQDEAGKFNKFGTYKLSDKLLWGSDYPMILKSISGYPKQYRLFHQAMQLNAASRRGYGKLNAGISRTDLIEKLTSTNPQKFLVG